MRIRLTSLRSIRNALIAAMSAAALGCAGSDMASLDGMLASAGFSRGLSDGTIASGLKEALEVGTQSAVSRTSREGGFFENPLIRIGIPESLEKFASGLRVIGMGRQVDELELTMNRAAERASGEATAVFWGAIKQMTFADVRAIWHGNATAATDYLDRTTRPELRSRFQPIVTEKMNQVGLSRLYDDLVARYTALPLTTTPPLDLQGYVTENSLDGLFSVLGEEEQKIREDPVARTSELLRRVFGS